MLNQKQIKQAREAVRRKPLQQILGFFDLVPSVRKGHHPMFSGIPLNHEQQARYCISEANRLVMQNDLTRAQGYIGWAHTLAITDPRHNESERLKYLWAMGKDKGEEFRPRYNLSLLKRLKSSIKYYSQRAEEKTEGEKPYAHKLVQESFNEYLEELNSILEERK